MMAVEQYRQYIQQLLTERSQHRSAHVNAEEYEVQTLFDTQRDHYQLLHVS